MESAIQLVECWNVLEGPSALRQRPIYDQVYVINLQLRLILNCEQIAASHSDGFIMNFAALQKGLVRLDLAYFRKVYSSYIPFTLLLTGYITCCSCSAASLVLTSMTC